MNEVRSGVLDRNPSTAFSTRSPATGSPTITERLLVPLMWVAIGVLASVTTPEQVAEPPLVQAVVADIFGWAGLVAMIGLTAAAIAARSSLRLWSLSVGIVGLTGLAVCQLIGHPVFTSAWGLGQFASVSGGIAVTAHLTARR